AVRDAVSILVGGNLGEIGFTLGAGLIDGRPPLNARQLLLVNLLTDVAPAMAIALRPPAPRSQASLALVGTQLGQTLLSGRMSRPVVVTGVASAAALALIVQTPGLSHAFGCRPLGPLGWGTAVGASAAATLGSVYLPELIARYRQEPIVSVVLDDPPILGT